MAKGKLGPKKSRTVTVPELKLIQASPSADPNYLGLRLTDDTGKTIILGANLATLDRFVMELIGAGSHLPPRPPEAHDDAPGLAATAHHIEITTGRTPNEAAVTIFVGSMRLQFAVDALNVLNEAAELSQELGPLPAGRLN